MKITTLNLLLAKLFLLKSVGAGIHILVCRLGIGNGVFVWIFTSLGHSLYSEVERLVMSVCCCVYSVCNNRQYNVS